MHKSGVGKRSPPKRLFPRNRQKERKQTNGILTGPLGLLALQAPRYKLNKGVKWLFYL